MIMNSTTTKPPGVPPPRQTTHTEGTLTCTWDNGVAVVAVLRQRKKDGKCPVRVLYGAQQVGSGSVDLANLNDRQRLHAECSHLDGQITDWLAYLMYASAAITALPQTDTSKRVQVLQLSTVTPERVEYLWKPYIPTARPVAIEGDPGIGKSTLVAKIIAHITSGKAFPNLFDGIPPPKDFTPQNVCLLTSEDDPADTLAPRIIANGGDTSRVFLITGWAQPDGEKGVVTMQDLAVLRQALEAHRPVLCVFDPIQSYFGTGIDMNHASDTRPVLDAVAELCKEYGCTPLYVRHIGKTQRAKALHAGLGSIDITGNMRSVLFLGQDPDNKERRIIAHSKSNNVKGPSMAYRVQTVECDIPTPNGGSVRVEAPRLDWDGRSELSADDLAAPPEVEKEENNSALEQAQEFLLELLKDGPVLYTEVKKALEPAGIAMITVKRAKPLVGVKSRRRSVADAPSKDRPWEWYLPKHATTEEE
jgi:hypothetical protein